ncbi:transducin family protein [Hibiscus syriacus]|uniref:Transducin family protein n=1 Tax=Hibiscus syriacus TaxID=106335 RepID=A0A6A3BV72_HIBSY|nr:uncharacterized protein LOC120209695 [Hibiscus syriacus]XP_039064562.1 uncharacterized protein LOC120209695 [Hibiscus syriacus]KAE8720435.1 transducin family protein [Hibiscus syriacus]
METLVVVAQHRNQYCSRVKPHVPAGFGSSPPSRNFRGANCRTSQSRAGLPTPFKYNSTLLTKKPSSPPFSPSSPKTPSPFADGLHSKGKATMKSSPIPINSNITPRNGKPFTEEISGEGFLYSELWAGPAYSNSPPPSSLPIPKFSLRMKRTVSLDLPAAAPVVDVHQTAKSAPASPTRELSPSVAELFRSADSVSATKALRRILNLDDTDY